MSTNTDTIIAATDGSALGNPGPAGWAWYIDENNWQSGGWSTATNNQGELMAVLQLLKASKEHRNQKLVINSDSRYVIDALTKWLPGWKRKGWRKADGKPVLNRNLLQEIDTLMQTRKIDFVWVKGHAGHNLNEKCDQLARAAAQNFKDQKNDFDHGPGFNLGTGKPCAIKETSINGAVAKNTSFTQNNSKNIAPDVFAVKNENQLF